MNKEIERIIKTALKEDIATGDLTTFATIKKNVLAKGNFLVKQNGTIAGLRYS